MCPGHRAGQWQSEDSSPNSIRVLKKSCHTICILVTVGLLYLYLSLRLTVTVFLSPWVSRRRAKEEPFNPRATCALRD